MGSSFIFLLLIVACVLALVLVVMAFRRIQKEGLTVSDEKREHFKRSVEDVQRQQLEAREEHAAANVSDDTSTGAVIYSKFGFGRVIGLDFDAAVDRVKSTLRVEELTLLKDADVVAMLHKKDMPKCRMLTIYHGDLAGRALEIDPSLGLLTSTVTIRQDLSDDVHVEFSDPSHHPGLSSHPDLHEVASSLKVKLLSALQAI